jgi:pimeloyl-ACP methyl ester carboxylesterase
MGAGGTQTVVSADGTEIEWQRSGHGEPLVLIHGTSADRTRWARVLPLLQPHFTVYAVDRRGREGLLRVFITEIVRTPLDQLEFLRSLPAWPARLAAAHTLVREVRADESYVFQPERWSEFDIPTLLLLGGDSPRLFTAAIEELNAALPQSTLRVLAGHQHAAMDTVPELFAQEILGFVTGN